MVPGGEEGGCFGESGRARGVEEADGGAGRDGVPVGVIGDGDLRGIDGGEEGVVDDGAGDAELGLDARLDFGEARVDLWVFVYEDEFRAADLQTVHEGFAAEVVVEERGRASDAEEAEPDYHEVDRVDEVHGDELAWFHAFGEEELRPLRGAVVHLLPCVGLRARPDAEVVGVFGDVGREGVPETEAVLGNCWGQCKTLFAQVSILSWSKWNPMNG